jgi:predicted metal-binding membrane protein
MTFNALSTLLCAVSAVVTILWCVSMSAMGGMPMPGGWTMSMAWMRMPGQTWASTAMSFLGMWTVMMVAMMLPSLVPMLRRYRERVGTIAHGRLAWLTALAGAGYFCVWILIGAAAFPLGIALADVEMQHATLARAAPIAAGAVILLAGLFQFSSWKARHLACCRYDSAEEGLLCAEAVRAWRHGVRLALHCSACCGNLILILLVIGVMDLRAMAFVTAAITFERLAPASERIVRGIGAVCAGAGVLLLVRAAGPG